MVSSQHHTTRLVSELKSGNSSAADRLLPAVYDHLHRVASRHFAGQPGNHTLQPTALVHEAFLKMVDQTGADYADEAHFCAVAATAMRQILINHAAARATRKRGGGRAHVPFDDASDVPVDAASCNHLVALHEALARLADHDERKARVVEMRFFGGMRVEQVAHVIGVSVSTVEADWRLARAWLSRELEA